MLLDKPIVRTSLSFTPGTEVIGASGSFSGSFTGSFAGDGSQLTNLPINTSSLATTGSNTFVGNQIVSGSVNVQGDLSVTGSATLQNINYVPTVTTIYDNTTVSIKTIDITSTEAVFFDYSIKSDNGAHKRAGGAIIMWSTNPVEDVQFTEYSTLDFGDTSAAVLSASISGTAVNVTMQNDTGHTLTVKSLARLF